jgi:hypothetical protein
MLNRKLSEYCSFRSCLEPFKETEENLVNTPGEIITHLKEQIGKAKDFGLLFSGGMDSAILAKLVPQSTKLYTIAYPGLYHEAESAKRMADYLGMQHYVVLIDWPDVEAHMDKLMINRKSPLHPMEAGIHTLANLMEEETLIVGVDPDSIFGALTKMLGRNWSAKEFERWFTFLPLDVLKEPVSCSDVFERYGDFDTLRFIKEVYSPSVYKDFENPISAAGKNVVFPYRGLAHNLNIDRVKKESKYLIIETFKELFPDIEVPPKLPFQRPVDSWMKFYNQTNSPVLNFVDTSKFVGQQKWMLYNIERFAKLHEQGHINF